MLTKNLLKFSWRKGSCHPKFIDPADMEVVGLGNHMDQLYSESIGLTIQELEEKVVPFFAANFALGSAFRKLLDDRLVFEEMDSDGIAEMRWHCLKRGQELRCRFLDDGPAAFQAEVAAELGKPFASLQEELYRDLPEFRQISSYRPLGPGMLGHRYNCAQVQGLLIHAKELNVRFLNLSVLQRRQLIRLCKFFRLLAEVKGDPTSGVMEVNLSGPLSLFDQSQAYGLRLANFFPYVLHFAPFEVAAEVALKGKTGLLKVTHKHGIKSHYPEPKGFLPEEHKVFLNAFNQTKSDWKVELSEDFLHLGGQHYSFPDFTLTQQGGKKMHIELFHRWHRYQLEQRLELIKMNAGVPLCLGICRSLKGQGLDEVLDNAQESGLSSFWFNDFPTPRAVLAQLTKLQGDLTVL